LRRKRGYEGNAVGYEETRLKENAAFLKESLAKNFIGLRRDRVLG